MESIFSSLLASSLLVGLPSIIILSIFIFIYIGILKKKISSREPLPPVIATYILQCLFSITTYWDNIVSQAKVYRISHDFIVFQCVTVVFILKLIETLKTCPKSLKELADVTKTNERNLSCLLRKLSNEGYFIYNDDDQKYEINNELPYEQDSIFTENKDCIYGLFQHPSISKAWGSTKECFPTDLQHRNHTLHHSNPSNFFNYIDEKDGFLKKIFDCAMRQKTELQKLHNQISTVYNFSKFKEVCEIGGGFGYLGFQILKHHPTTNIIILEMEETIKHGMEIATNDSQKKELMDNNQLVFKAGDMFQPRTIPRSNAYILSEILGVWNKHDCLKILQSISNVMRKEKLATGKSPVLIIVDSVIEDSSGCGADKIDDQLSSLSIPKMVMWSIISTTDKRSRLEWDCLFRDSGLFVNNSKKINQHPYLYLIELTV